MEDSAGKITELNERQRSGMDAAKLLAEMGLDVTVYASTEADRKAGMENGSIRLSDGSIRVDLNAGADGQGVMAFALSHEFTHFVEEMSPKKFRTFTDILFEEAAQKGTDVSALIEAKAQALGKMEENKGLSENALNDLAYSEVTAEMMETALTDTDVMERISARLQQTDKSLWGKIKDFLKGLVERLKAAYKGLNPDSSIARLARETISSSERALDAFADAASDAVVNYRLQDGQKNDALEGVQFSQRNVNGEQIVWIEDSGLTNKQLRDYQQVANYIASHVGEVYTIIESGSKVYLGEDLPSEYVHSKYTTYLRNADKSTLKAKNKAVDGLGEMIEIATNRRWEKTRHTTSKDAAYGMYRYDSKFAFPVKDSVGNQIGVRAYDVELLIRNASDGKKYLYDIVNIKKNTANVLELQKMESRNGSVTAAAQSGAPVATVSQPGTDVKGILKSSRNATDTQYMEFAKDPEGNRLELETMVQDAAEEAGFVYKRNTRRKHAPANAVPWQMFVRGVDADQSNYGDYTYYATDAGAMSIEEIMPRVQELAEEFYGSTLSEEEINPPDIVDTAGIWDDKDFVQYLWDNYFEGIMDETGSVPAVLTDDGMIVLDEDNTRVKSGDAVEYDDSGNVIPLSERFNARADDIRYSSRQRADGKAEQLATEVEYLKKLVQIQKKGNSDYTLDRTSLKQFASQLIRENGASGSSTELAALLEDTYNYISRSTDFLWEGIEERAGKAVDWLEAHRKVQRDSYAQEVLDFMSKRHVKLSEAQLGEKPLCGRRSSHSGIVFVGAYFVPVSATPFAYRV